LRPSGIAFASLSLWAYPFSLLRFALKTLPKITANDFLSPFVNPLASISAAQDRYFCCATDMRRLIASLWYRFRIPFAMGPPLSLLLFALKTLQKITANDFLSPFVNPLASIGAAHDRYFCCNTDMRRLIASLWYRFRIPFAMGPLFAIAIRVENIAKDHTKQSAVGHERWCPASSTPQLSGWRPTATSQPQAAVRFATQISLLSVRS